MELDEKHDRTQPDVQNLSRFAMTTGTLLCVVVIAGGTPDKEWKSTLLPLKFAHPEFLFALFLILAVYSAWRYWHYGINLPLTRQKIREYLKQSEAVLVAQGIGRNTAQPIGIAAKDSEAGFYRAVIEQMPRDLNEDEVIFLSKRSPDESTKELAKTIVAKQLQKYFPKLTENEVIIDRTFSNPSFMYLAHVSPENRQTLVRVALEDLDLWTPVLLNILGFLLLLTSLYFCWPSSLCVFGK